MKRIKVFFGVIVASCAAIMLSTSCASNNKEVLYGCSDSTNVSFSKSIKPIINSNCIVCHYSNNGTKGGGNELVTYDNIFNFVDTATGGDGGTLLNDIKHIANPMPQSASKLSDCDIAKFEHWIKEGAKNN